MTSLRERRNRVWFAAVAVFVALGAASSAGAEQPSADSSSPTFEQDVRPILKARCFHCHGEQGKLEGGLDLRLRRLIVAGGESGPAVAAGMPENSYLLDRVRSGEMPRGDTEKLSAEQIKILERWIAGGEQRRQRSPQASPRAS